MDWRSITFDWNQARAFLVTAEEGSLSAAARALGLTQPTLGRQVDALQQALGVVLFERAGRGLTLTPAGQDLLEHVRDMGEDARRFALAASGRSQVLEGTIAITASQVYCGHVLPPVLARLRQQAPGIAIDLVATNAPVDLLRREADIAIRNFRSEQPDLIQRRLPDDAGRLYAAPELLDRLGNPTTPEALGDAEFVGFDRTDRLIEVLGTRGIQLTQANFPIVTTDQMVQWELVKRGLVIGVMTQSVGDAEPGVRPVLPHLPPIAFQVWIASHREVGMSRRVRFVFDAFAEALGKG